MTYTVAPESFDALESGWTELLARSDSNKVFLTPLWQRLWWRWMGQDTGLLLLSARNSTGLRGIAPLARRDGALTFLGGTDLVDYHDFIVPDEGASDVYAALVDYLMQDSGWDTVRLESLPEGSNALEELPAALRAHGLDPSVELEDVAPGIRLPESWEDYLSGLKKKDRHELRRKLRRLEGAGTLRCYAVSAAEDLPEAMDCLLGLMRQSRDDKAEFMTAEREQFFRDMARELLDAGVLRLFFLELDGARVAATLCMDYRGARFLYNSGFDRAYDHLSVGLLLKVLCLRDAIESGMTYYDLLRGDERYKYDLGAEDVRIYTLTARRG